MSYRINRAGKRGPRAVFTGQEVIAALVAYDQNRFNGNGFSGDTPGTLFLDERTGTLIVEERR